jgi:salicylate hydroxylase
MIIGGGIGGLCLAQGLRRAGIAATVYERTRTSTDWLQGYRIHLNPHGSRALHDCLPPAVWQQFLDSVSVNDGGVGFATEQLDDLLRFTAAEILPDAGPADAHYGASRISLREVLLSDLDDVVHLGKTFERYELNTEGRVIAHFSDGTSATADLLVGADGANSRVRRQLLPYAQRIDTGILAVAGKHRLERATLPRTLREDANIIIPASRGFLFTAAWQPDRMTIGDQTPPREFLLGKSSCLHVLGIRRRGQPPPSGHRDPEWRRPARRRAQPDQRLGASTAGVDWRLGPGDRERGPRPQRDTRRPMADWAGDLDR